MKFNSIEECKDDGSGWGAHLEVLKKIFLENKIKSVLEFGMGHFSTEFFLLNNCQVTSIEMQDQSWFIKMRDSIGKNINWNPLLILGAYKSLQKPIPENTFDLAFIDGHLDSRPDCINFCFGKVPIIVAHDFECPVYKWDRIEQPINYLKKVFNVGNTQVIVFTLIP